MATLTEAPRAKAGRPVPMSGGLSAVGLGAASLWLSLMVLLPLAALLVTSLDRGPADFWAALTNPGAIGALRVTLGVSVVVTAVNSVFGVLIAWVLVRDEFRGKFLVNALIDLPFALPTIVASIVLLALYGPQSPIHLQLNATRPALVIALLFVTLPFVVRQVQPVLIELDREVEEADASLGAPELDDLPGDHAANPGAGDPEWRGTGVHPAIGEYGSVVLIGGGIRFKTEVASQYIQKQIEADSALDGAVVSVALLTIAFVVLAGLRYIAGRIERDVEA